MADVIESDRQKNGDFGTFEALGRVKGIGNGRLKGWQPYFSDRRLSSQGAGK